MDNNETPAKLTEKQRLQAALERKGLAFKKAKKEGGDQARLNNKKISLRVRSRNPFCDHKLTE